MLTEKGIDKALRLSRIPISTKQRLPVLTYEVQKIKNTLENAKRIKNYDPVDIKKKTLKTSRESLIRTRGFRQAIIHSYNFSCCVCGLKVASPDSLVWEVEAAHIVPHHFHGKDDVWNGIALCHFHHWLFDVGWFTLRNDYTIEVNKKIIDVPLVYSFMGNVDVLRQLLNSNAQIRLPKNNSIFPHENSISWHRDNIFIHL